MSRDLLITVSQFAKRRQVSLVVVGSVSVLALVIWNIASGIAHFNDERSAVRIEQLVDGTFLGIEVADNTHDQFMNNVELRLAMNEGFTKSNSVRKYQMGMIWLQDGQHPDTGTPAVLVTVEPGRGEIPSPPFVPVAVRRWEPGSDEEYVLDDLQTMRLVYPPNKKDLDRLREVWSGGRFSKSDSLFGSIRWMFVYLVIGMGLIVVAGAYRALAWRSSRWDRAADVQRHDAALERLQSARDSK
ncbi:MAG: hypothetical protein O3C40_02165 [Planctomycetota bacterium]|nr:hypothetical protein [Planctomycetota bacterium]